MSRNILNDNEINVYLNRDPIEATLPVQAIQASNTDPIVISLKGLNGMTANKVIKVNSAGTALEYADDQDTTEWILSSGLLYPNLTTTDVAIGGTTNSDNRKLKVHGDAEITTQLYLTGTSSTIELNNNSSSGLYFNNNTGQGFKLFADNGFSGSPHLNNMTSSGWLFKISSTGTIKHRFLNGITEIYSDGASTDTTKHYFVKASNTNIGNYIQNDFTNNTFQLRTFTSTTDEYFLQYDTANEILTIPNKLVLSATTNQLSDGTNNYILPSSSGTLQLTTDPINATTTTLFGTAVTGGNTIKLGSQNANLEFYFSASLKLYNNSGALIGQFTPVSNTCNLSLNSGVISSATWEGGAIQYNYGGTGITSITGQANKALVVASNELGYTFSAIPATLWNESSSVLTPATSTNHILAQNELRIGSSTYQVYLDYSAGGNEFKFNYADRSTSTEIAINKYNNSFNVFTQYVNTVFESPITVNSIKGENSATNTIKDDGARGWEFVAVDATRAIAIESGSYYPYLGVDTNKPFLIHINNIGGNAYEINNTNNTLAGLRHEFYGDVVFNSVIRAEGGSLPIRIGSVGDYTALEYSEASDIFYLYNSTSTKYFMEYQAIPQTTLFRTNNFTISSGTANNDCVLLIEADTDNNDENANPEIRLRADGGVTGMNMKLDNNDLIIETIYSGQDIQINPYSSANCEINAGLTSCSDDFKCASSRFRVEYISSLTYFYNPSGSHSGGGSASYAGSYWSYHDNGTAIYFNLPSGATSSGAYYGFATSNSQKARIDMTGSGKITGSWTGGWAGTSDRRLKKNIVPIENAVDTLMKINVYQFDKYDIDNFDCIHHDEDEDTLKPFTERLSKDTRFVYGFIAQELYENTPEIGKMCIETNDWGEEEPAYIIDDRPILACAIKTIQTQQEEINTLKQELQNIKDLLARNNIV